jgi:hypothetical protein
VYEKAQYECRHVLDADLTWTKEEEKKLVRKLDWHGGSLVDLQGLISLTSPIVCLWACVMFFSLQVDRGNLGQAVSGRFLTSILIRMVSMRGHLFILLLITFLDYNLRNTVFLVSFLVAELPSQLVSKKIGPDRWIPTQMVLWSVVAMAQAALKGKRGFLATRALLGILEVTTALKAFLNIGSYAP